MKTSKHLVLTALATFATLTSACDVDEAGYEPIAMEPSEGLDVSASGDESLRASTLTCDLDEQAAVGGLYYPGWTCNDAIANAESSLSSWHYRNACNQQVGSDIDSPVDAAQVTNCTNDGSNAIVTVDLCCEAPPGLTCDLDEQAAVGGLYYPGWTCDDAIANAESSLSSWHYRNACNQQVGSDISSPVDAALVTDCTHDGSNAIVTVDLCCDAPSAVSAEPVGTRKMCIAGGTAAEMLADCEDGAQVNVDLFTGGTWDTQEFINQWGDPCPAGTSIVPNSQYYVANSCNPLPNVGVGCGGAGSYNYEFQIGVYCQ
ncbi:hypothetical protein G6O69_21410 [Pseudenhygromyxa sp. WMMC2535]|uniref:hypothetical protein n=1 Tax=Pseudenhygromyxa sp. WMMC2535 TaxID=2712867 RepID=UPI001555AAB0|nr:hypothetical protein [Pseudenhygromyxa sp. WMMC2535]NVB40412.1 hypothetical protein [Pseudenhygromyxa sp. WMMC2535]